jgi:hypothetical protein
MRDGREHRRKDRVAVLKKKGAIARHHLGAERVERAPELRTVDAIGRTNW